jgi:hypothetical protein
LLATANATTTSIAGQTQAMLEAQIAFAPEVHKQFYRSRHQVMKEITSMSKTLQQLPATPACRFARVTGGQDDQRSHQRGRQRHCPHMCYARWSEWVLNPDWSFQAVFVRAFYAHHWAVLVARYGASTSTRLSFLSPESSRDHIVTHLPCKG